jgi:hypothetical protein
MLPGGQTERYSFTLNILAYVELAATVWPGTKGPIVRSQGLFAPPARR